MELRGFISLTYLLVLMAAVPTIGKPCDTGWYLYQPTNRCFKTTAKSVTFSDANLTGCPNGLAVFQSEEEMQDVLNYVRNFFTADPDTYIWVGLYSDNNDWVWAGNGVSSFKVDTISKCIGCDNTNIGSCLYEMDASRIQPIQCTAKQNFVGICQSTPVISEAITAEITTVSETPKLPLTPISAVILRYSSTRHKALLSPDATSGERIAMAGATSLGRCAAECLMRSKEKQGEDCLYINYNKEAKACEVVIGEQSQVIWGTNSDGWTSYRGDYSNSG